MLGGGKEPKGMTRLWSVAKKKKNGWDVPRKERGILICRLKGGRGKVAKREEVFTSGGILFPERSKKKRLPKGNRGKKGRYSS